MKSGKVTVVSPLLTFRRILVGASVALAVLAIGGGVFLSKKDSTGVGLRIISGKADLEIRDFHFTEVGHNDSRWEIQANRAHYRRTDQEVLLFEVRARFLSLAGRVFTMTADKGMWSRESGNIELSGHVVATSDEGEWVKTEKLRYSARDNSVCTEGDILIKNKGMQIIARGMTYTLDEVKLLLSSQVKAIINEKAWKP